MTQPRRLIAGLVAAALAAACSSNPSGPTDGGVDHLTATIDGQPFTATIMAAMISSPTGSPNWNIVGLNGCPGDTSVQVMLQPASAVGTFAFAAGQAGVDAVTGNINRMSGGQSQGAWDNVFGTPRSGTITITSLSTTRVAGTFDFPVLRGGSAPTTRSFTNGSFDIQIANRKIC